MAITSEIIGKFGGAEVEVVSVSIPSLGGNGSTEVMHTVNVPPGETRLVAVVGTGTEPYGSYNLMPHIIIDGKIVRQATGHFAAAAIMVESGDVIFKSNTAVASSFEGNIYTVKMELHEITGV